MLLVRVPWCQRPWALPVMSVPTGQMASHDNPGCTDLDLARETLATSAGDCADRRWGFAAASLGHTCRRLRVRFVSRLLLKPFIFGCCLYYFIISYAIIYF